MDNRETIRSALKIIGSGGLSGLSVAASNAVQGLDALLKQSGQTKADAGRVLRQLKQQGLAEVINKDGSWHYTLTPAGLHRLQRIVIDELEIPRPAKWDKKWRLVIFDVPVNQSTQRTRFVSQLQRLGFVMLQKSVWVHPFPCFEQVEQLAGYYNVMRHCSLVEVSWLDNVSDARLRRRFSSLLGS